MAEANEATSLIKKETEPERDPIVARSTSAIILICTLLLMVSAVWALWDEAYTQRPWRSVQREYVKRYDAYLKSIRKDAGNTEKEVKDTPEYQELADKAKEAEDNTKDQRREIDARVAKIQA